MHVEVRQVVPLRDPLHDLVIVLQVLSSPGKLRLAGIRFTDKQRPNAHLLVLIRESLKIPPETASDVGPSSTLRATALSPNSTLA